MEEFIIDVWWDIIAIIVFSVTGVLVAMVRKRRAMLLGEAKHPTKNQKNTRRSQF